MIPYSLHVAVLLGFCLAFYKLLLQKQTYFQLNRWLLLACMAFSFVSPLIVIPQKLSLRGVVQARAIEQATRRTDDADKLNKTLGTASTSARSADQEPNAERPKAVTSTVATSRADSFSQLNRDNVIRWSIWVYWTGVVIFAGNFLLQIVVLLYRAYKKPAISDGLYRIVELDDDQAPCSFGNSIFINPAKYDPETYNQILLHEKEHVKQGHTFDLIFSELMLVLQWFNPFAWLYRKEIQSNLEFLTDDAMLRRHKVEVEDYQMSLLKVSVPNYAMHLTTNYNSSLLKKRIIMMNARRSNLHSSWKYFTLAPLLVILVCAFNPQAVSNNMPADDEKLNALTFPNGKTIKFKGDTTIDVTEMMANSVKTKNDVAEPVSKRTLLDSVNIRDVKLEALYEELRKYTLMLKPVFMNPKLGDPSIKPDLEKYDKQLAKMNIKYPSPIINSAPALKTEFEDYPNIKMQYIGYYISLEDIATYTNSPAYLAKLANYTSEDHKRLNKYLEN